MVISVECYFLGFFLFFLQCGLWVFFFLIYIIECVSKIYPKAISFLVFYYSINSSNIKLHVIFLAINENSF